jgi:hypothetical protein
MKAVLVTAAGASVAARPATADDAGKAPRVRRNVTDNLTLVRPELGRALRAAVLYRF